MKILRKIVAFLTAICRVLGFVANSPSHGHKPCRQDAPAPKDASHSDGHEGECKADDNDTDAGVPV